MLYLGGKGRLGKHIAAAILSHTDRRGDYYEPFLGGGNSFQHLAPHFARVHAGDVHEDLMLMWQEIARGWEPPNSISEAEYKALRRAEPSALRGFAGFGCSFGGKWWGGYARSKKAAPNYYADHTARTTTRLAPFLRTAVLRCGSYAAWSPEEGAVVYADPPYAGTTEYKNAFDHVAFWQTMNTWSERGVHVYVSEYVAPMGWRPIWEASHRCKVSGGTGEHTLERLFVRA